MSLKKQIINYFEFNKTAGGNFIFFDELPKIRKEKTTVNADIQTTNQVLNEQKLKPIEVQKLEVQKSNSETFTVNTVQPILEKIMPEEKTNSKKIDADFSKIELPNLDGYKTLEELKNAISNCQNCILGATRNNFVFGEGNPNADIMVIGEAPGADEDEQGLPFVGRAGKLLTDILRAINFERNEVYIANICKYYIYET